MTDFAAVVCSDAQIAYVFWQRVPPSLHVEEITNATRPRAITRVELLVTAILQTGESEALTHFLRALEATLYRSAEPDRFVEVIFLPRVWNIVPESRSPCSRCIPASVS